MASKVKVLDDYLDEARALAREGSVLDAGKYLRALETKFPESSEIQFLLGACYAKVDRIDLARRAWMKSVDLAPSNYRAKAWLAKLEQKDPTNFEITEDGASGALSGDLDACWDPTA
jgi:Flp pilus assembly protein TadD